jgi:AcrR family transcriptional regulator
MAASPIQDRSTVSKQKILDSATRCLVEHGYAGASTLRIQQLAEVSRGRLLHYFPSKDELLVAAVRHLAESRVAELKEQSLAAITAGPGEPARIDQAVDLMWIPFHQPYFWASLELWIAARHNEPLRAALQPAERKLRRSIHGTVDAMFGPVFAARSRYPQTKNLLVSSMRGVAATYTYEQRRSPTRDPHLVEWKDTARVLLSTPEQNSQH